MFRDFSWYLRECALREYAIWSENYGKLADRAYDRCLRFLTMADFLYRTHTSFDLEYEYRLSIGDFEDN